MCVCVCKHMRVHRPILPRSTSTNRAMPKGVLCFMVAGVCGYQTSLCIYLLIGVPVNLLEHMPHIWWHTFEERKEVRKLGKKGG